MRRHVSFNVVSTSLRCVERAQTGQQYSATERHSAVAVVLMVWGHAPQFVPCSFLTPPEEVVSGGEFCARLEAVVSVGE